MAAREKRLDVEIFVLSDGTGDTGANAVRAAMLQFDVRCRLRTFAGVRRVEHAKRVMQEAAKTGALVLFTVVDPAVERALQAQAAELSVPILDLLGPLINRFAEHLHAEPQHRPGLLHGFSDDYFRRIEAVEFAVRHDDGANLHTLFDADLVLTGVSRTSKTPLSMYLAQRGYKTGNVPLIPGLDTPRELLELNPRKVYGLVVGLETLLTVRRARVQTMGAAPYLSYVDPETIHGELQQAKRLFRERGWRVVDISGRAVEENAARIIELHEGAAALRGWL